MSRPQVRLNHAELDALKGMPHAARVLYVEGVRPFMDYSNGMVGASNSPSKSISLQSLAEVLYVEPAPGRTGTGSRSRKQARVCLDLLVDAGLIVSKSVSSLNSKRLVLKCILASTDESAQKKQGTNRAQEQGTNRAQDESSSINGLGGTDTQQQGTGKTADQGTPPRSVIHIDTHKPRARDEAITIPADFEIDAEVHARLVRGMVSLEFAESLLQEFINANESSGYVSKSWPAEFVKYCIRQKRFKESFDARHPQKGGIRLVSSRRPDGGDGSHGFNVED